MDIQRYVDIHMDTGKHTEVDRHRHGHRQRQTRRDKDTDMLTWTGM